MAAIKLYYPDIAKAPVEEIFRTVNFGYLIDMMMDFSEYYDKAIPIERVLQRYGIAVDGTREVQIPCMFPEHGSMDNHYSARYYPMDRESGEEIGAVHCFKCQKTRRAFWLLYAKEKEENRLADFFVWLQKAYGVPFPAHMVAEFDPDVAYQLKSGRENEHIQLLQNALMVQEHFARNTPEFASSLHTILTQR